MKIQVQLKKYIHKDLIFVVREENKFVGIKVKGYQGDLYTLAESFQNNVKNIDAIKETVANDGAVMESIEPYEELINKD